MNAVDIFLILLIIFIVVLALRKIILDKKKGRSCCGDCSQCGGCDKNRNDCTNI